MSGPFQAATKIKILDIQKTSEQDKSQRSRAGAEASRNGQATGLDSTSSLFPSSSSRQQSSSHHKENLHYQQKPHHYQQQHQFPFAASGSTPAIATSQPVWNATLLNDNSNRQRQYQQQREQQREEGSSSIDSTSITLTPTNELDDNQNNNDSRRLQELWARGSNNNPNLSSFESDRYDLLVYLGGETETETEDLLDTERSFDYQDQALRQTSICDAASLAPTLDSSISELLFASPIQPIDAAAHSRHDPCDDFLSPCEPPTPTIKDPQQSQEEAFLPIKLKTRQEQEESESDQDLQTLYVTASEQSNGEETASMIYAQKQQLNARRHAPSNQNQHQNNKSPTSSSPSPNPRFESAMFSANDAAELDRLLAEMSQSLDLDSLARFDSTSGGRPRQTTSGRIGSRQQQQAIDSEKATHRAKLDCLSGNNSKPNLNNNNNDNINYNDNHQRTERREKAATLASANPTGQASQPGTTTSIGHHSNESILDEYDDASRILEQMISDAQMASNHQFQHHISPKIQQTLIEPPTPTQTPNRAYEPKLIECTLVKASLPPSASEMPIISQQLHKASKNNNKNSPEIASGPQWARDLRRQKDIRESPLSTTIKNKDRLSSSSRSGSWDSRRAWRDSRKLQMLTQSTAEECPPPPASDYRRDSCDSSPPELPKKDYPPLGHPDWHSLGGQNVIEATANEHYDSDADEGRKWSSHTPGKAQLAWMKRRTMSSMRSMRSKLSDFMAHSGDAWANHNYNANTSSNTNNNRDKSATTRVEQVAAKFESKLNENQNANAKERESRSRSRNVARKSLEPLSEQLSNLGQEIRKRLSRSKSRLGEIFLNSKQNRAKSMPIDKTLAASSLPADDDATRPTSAATTTATRSDSSSSLSGLEKTTTKPMKRLSGIKMMPTSNQSHNNNAKKMILNDAGDGGHQNLSELPQPIARRNKHSRNRRRKQAVARRTPDEPADLKQTLRQEEDKEASQQDRDYFLQKIPMSSSNQSSSSSSKSDGESEADNRQNKRKRHQLPGRLAKSSQSLNRQTNNNTVSPDSFEMEPLEARKGELEKKSQSLRCLGKSHRTRQQTTSACSRRLPESSNTFRPASVARMLTSPVELEVSMNKLDKPVRESRGTTTRSAMSKYSAAAAKSHRRSTSSQSSSEGSAPNPPPRSRQRAKSMHAQEDAPNQSHPDRADPILKPSKSRLSILGSQLKQMAPFKSSSGDNNKRTVGPTRDQPSRLPRPVRATTKSGQHKLDQSNEANEVNDDNESLCHWSPVVKSTNGRSISTSIPSWLQQKADRKNPISTKLAHQQPASTKNAQPVRANSLAQDSGKTQEAATTSAKTTRLDSISSTSWDSSISGDDAASNPVRKLTKTPKSNLNRPEMVRRQSQLHDHQPPSEASQNLGPTVAGPRPTTSVIAMKPNKARNGVLASPGGGPFGLAAATAMASAEAPARSSHKRSLDAKAMQFDVRERQGNTATAANNNNISHSNNEPSGLIGDRYGRVATSLGGSRDSPSNLKPAYKLDADQDQACKLQFPQFNTTNKLDPNDDDDDKRATLSEGDDTQNERKGLVWQRQMREEEEAKADSDRREKTNRYGWRRNIGEKNAESSPLASDLLMKFEQQQQPQKQNNDDTKSMRTKTSTKLGDSENENKHFQFNSDLPEPSKLHLSSLLNKTNENDNENRGQTTTRIPILNAKSSADRPNIHDTTDENNTAAALPETTKNLANEEAADEGKLSLVVMDSNDDAVGLDGDDQAQDDEGNEKREAEERETQNRLSVYENAPATLEQQSAATAPACGGNQTTVAVATTISKIPTTMKAKRTTAVGHNNKQVESVHDSNGGDDKQVGNFELWRPKPPAKPASLACASKKPEHQRCLETRDHARDKLEQGDDYDIGVTPDKKFGAPSHDDDYDDDDEELTPPGERVAPNRKLKHGLVKRTSIIQEPYDELMIAATSQSRPVVDSANDDQFGLGNHNGKNIKSKKASYINNSSNIGSFDEEFGVDNLQYDDDTDSSLADPINLNSKQKLINSFDKHQRQNQSPLVLSPKPRNQSSKTLPITRRILHQEPLPQLPVSAPKDQQPGPSGSLVKRLAMNFDRVAQENAARPNIASNIAGKLSQHSMRSFDDDHHDQQPRKKFYRQPSHQDEDPKSESTWYDARSAADTDLDEAEVAEFLRTFDQQQTNQDHPNSNTPTNYGLINTNSSVSISTGADPYETVAEDDTADNTNNDLDDNDDTLNDGVSVCDDILINSNNGSQGANDDYNANYNNNDNSFPNEFSDKGNDNYDINQRQCPIAISLKSTAYITLNSENKNHEFACRFQNNNAKNKPAENTDHSTSLLDTHQNYLRNRNINSSKLSSSLSISLQNFVNIHYHVNNNNMYSKSIQKQEISSSNLRSPGTPSLRPDYFETPKQRLSLSDQGSGNEDVKDTSSLFTSNHPFNSSSSSPTNSLTSSFDDSFGDYRTPGLDLREKGNLDLSRDSMKLIKTARTFSDLYNELENILAKRVANKWRSISRIRPDQKNESSDNGIIVNYDKIIHQRDLVAAAPDQIGNLIDLDSDSNQEMKKDTQVISNIKILETLSDYEHLQTSSNYIEPNDDGIDSSANMPETLSINNLDDEDYDETLSTTTEHDDQLSLSSTNEVSTELLNEFRRRKNSQKLYHIVNEIYSSEAKFVDTLVLLNVDFRNYMQTQKTYTSTCNLSVHQHCKLLNPTYPQECINSILKHLPQLQALNENLLEELRIARSEWPDTQKIAHVLVKIGPFLKHYSIYIRDYENIWRQFIDNMKKYPQFADRVLQFEASDRCQRLTIQHHLLKPIQRLPQYRLLLQQYLHHLNEDDVDYEDTVKALEVVSQVAEHANQSMNEDAKFAKLLAIQGRIINKRIDIVKPSRVFVKEGELMKVCRKHIQPRWFVLLNDAILYLTQVPSSDIFYFNKELSLDDCQVTISEASNDNENKNNLNVPESNHQNDGSLNVPSSKSKITKKNRKLKHKLSSSPDLEFSVFTKTRSFTLIAKSVQERDDWVSAFRRTIDEYVARRKSFTIKPILDSPMKHTNSLSVEKSISSPTIGQAQTPIIVGDAQAGASKLQDIKSVSTIENFTLGKKAPLWTPDSKVAHCESCTKSFSALFRRHHCRACGKVICSACSSNRAPLVYLKFKSARVCDTCFDVLKANINQYGLPPRAFKDLSGRLTRSELCRLEEHIRVMVKSQFVKHAGLLRWFVKPPSS